MNKFHSTVSRRNFMKGLGLAGVGLSAAAASAPVFHDVDEITSAKGSHPEMRWWIKEREYEDITTPIDWGIFQKYDRKVNPMPGFGQTENLWKAEQQALDDDGIKNSVPGRSVRDLAFSNGSSFIGPNAPWNGPNASLPDGGVPWQGTPEENLKTMRAAIHTYGCKTVGAFEMNEHMDRCFDKGSPVWDSSLDSYEGYRDDDRVYHVPGKCRYVLTFATKQNTVQSLYQLFPDPTDPDKYGYQRELGGQAIGQAYSHAAQLKYMTMRMIKGLGYGAYSTGIAMNTSVGVLSGLGEQGRPGYTCSPDYGLALRYTTYIITDLPLAPTKPIDGGVQPFCKTCMRCADACPSGACSTETDHTYEVRGIWNRPGHNGWHMDWDKCCSYGSPQSCGNCQVVCPFNHPEEGAIHTMVRGIAGTTSAFDNMFAGMDKFMGYAKPKGIEEMADWWDRDLSKWKYDTLLGFGQSVW